MDVACVANTNDVLGEVPRWHALENALYWIDALKPAVYRFDPAARRGRELDAAGEARLVRAERGRRADHRGAQRLCAVRSAWRRSFDAHRRSGEQGGREHPQRRPLRQPRPLLGRLDDQDDAARERKALSRRRSGRVDACDDGIWVSNGVAWSPDDKTMYFADSHVHAIFAL